MSFTFQPIDYSGINNRIRGIRENMRKHMDEFAKIGQQHQTWAEHQAALEKQAEKERQEQIKLQKQQDALDQRKQWFMKRYGNADWKKYGPLAEISSYQMNQATSPEDWDSSYDNLAAAINTYETTQALSDKQNEENAKAAEQKRLDDEFAMDMYDFNHQDWSQANIWEQLNNSIDPDIASPAEIVKLQQLLGVKGTGFWGKQSKAAYNQAKAAWDAKQQIQNDIIGKYGAKKFIDAMGDEEQKRILEKALTQNKAASYVPQGSGW